MKFLQQLSHSSVTAMDISNAGISSLLKTHFEYWSALKIVIDPRSGQLEKLHVGDRADLNLDLISATSSLTSLVLCKWNYALSGLENNTSLLELYVDSSQILISNIKKRAV